MDKTGMIKLVSSRVITQGKLFQRCTHLLYCSVLSLGGNVKTRRMSKPDMGSIFHKKSMKYSSHRKLLCELSKLSKFNAFNLLGYATTNNFPWIIILIIWISIELFPHISWQFIYFYNYWDLVIKVLNPLKNCQDDFL